MRAVARRRSRCYERLESDPRGPVHWGMAEVYAALGENEQALRSLELAYEQRFNY